MSFLYLQHLPKLPHIGIEEGKNANTWSQQIKKYIV